MPKANIATVQPLDAGTPPQSTQELLAIISAGADALKAMNEARKQLKAMNAKEITELRYAGWKQRKAVAAAQAEYDAILAQHEALTGVGKFFFTDDEETHFTRRYTSESKS